MIQDELTVPSLHPAMCLYPGMKHYARHSVPMVGRCGVGYKNAPTMVFVRRSLQCDEDCVQTAWIQ